MTGRSPCSCAQQPSACVLFLARRVSARLRAASDSSAATCCCRFSMSLIASRSTMSSRTSFMFWARIASSSSFWRSSIVIRISIWSAMLVVSCVCLPSPQQSIVSPRRATSFSACWGEAEGAPLTGLGCWGGGRGFVGGGGVLGATLADGVRARVDEGTGKLCLGLACWTDAMRIDRDVTDRSRSIARPIELTRMPTAHGRARRQRPQSARRRRWRRRRAQLVDGCGALGREHTH